MKLSDNTVLITGGSSGIGRAMAEAFLEAGSEVIVCARREERLLELQKEHPGLHARTCDVGSVDDCRALAKWAGERFPNLNVLVNNAGIQRDIDFTRGADALFEGDDEVRINLEGPVVLSALFVPLLKGKEGAAIVNVSSGLGPLPIVRMPVYSATKAALHAFSMALRPQLATIGIEVIEVIPPAVDTELNPEGRAKRGGFKPDLGPEAFVASVMKDLEAGRQEIVFGGSERMLEATKGVQKLFEQMNGRW